MTSRERFRKAINHEQPDRVPVDVGQDFHNGIHDVAYIMSGGHNIQADVPPENILALFDTAFQCGQYPDEARRTI